MIPEKVVGNKQLKTHVQQNYVTIYGRPVLTRPNPALPVPAGPALPAGGEEEEDEGAAFLHVISRKRTALGAGQAAGKRKRKAEGQGQGKRQGRRKRGGLGAARDPAPLRYPRPPHSAGTRLPPSSVPRWAGEEGKPRPQGWAAPCSPSP